jgi:hypothetical protein
MAAITPTFVQTVQRGWDKAQLATWTPTTLDADTFTPVEVHDRPARAVQVSGTFDGATITMKGSIDGTTYYTLKQTAGGTDVALSAAGLQQIYGDYRYIKPATSGAGAGTTLTVKLLCRA